jgi:hypothetical protein
MNLPMSVGTRTRATVQHESAVTVRQGVVSRLMGKLQRRSSGSPPFVPVAVLLLAQDPSRSYRGGAGIADE